MSLSFGELAPSLQEVRLKFERTHTSHGFAGAARVPRRSVFSTAPAPVARGGPQLEASHGSSGSHASPASHGSPAYCGPRVASDASARHSRRAPGSRSSGARCRSGAVAYNARRPGGGPVGRGARVPRAPVYGADPAAGDRCCAAVLRLPAAHFRRTGTLHRIPGRVIRYGYTRAITVRY